MVHGQKRQEGEETSEREKNSSRFVVEKQKGEIRIRGEEN
jgi:hypothetical protein